MSESFAVHIGGGAYLNASGNLVFAPPPGAQIYQAPKGFRVDPKKIQDVLMDLSDILPRDDDGKKKWRDWGVPEKVVNAFGKAAGVAGIVATSLAVYLWAVGAIISIMELMSDDDGLSPELGRALFNIKSQLQGEEQIQRADTMIAMHAEFDGRIDLMHGLVTTLLVEKPTRAAKANIFAQMRVLVDQLAVPLSQLRNQVWTATYDSDAYKSRAFVAALLVFERSDGTLVPVPSISPNVTVFDYRLGVPMLIYGATVFTALAQVAMPWFRSAGIYAAQLRKTADAIDRFVIRMQDESLARTEYTPGEVLHQEIWKAHDVARGTGGPRTFFARPAAFDYVVGAFDLVGYSDMFMWERYSAAFPTNMNLGQRGLFNYDWYPPDRLGLEEIAALANEQSHQDYAHLQVATGMFTLIRTAAWLRYLSTPPAVSETVSGVTIDGREFISEQPTKARSPHIHSVGVIESDATLKRYAARSRVRLTVQEAGYVPAFRYRVVLRTIHSLAGNEGWHGKEYVGDVWRFSYEPTQGDPRTLRLRTDVLANAVLSEEVLFEGTSNSTPPAPSGTANLRAATFDWYVPVVSVGSRYLDPDTDIPSVAKARQKKAAALQTEAPAAATGGVSIHLRGGAASSAGSLHVMDGPGPLMTTSSDRITEHPLSEATWGNAERRHVKVEEVQIHWQLTWNDGKAEVKLSGNPSQRPFQAYVVVEEIVYSGETLADDAAELPADAKFHELHTPFATEIVNQLVFVPEQFFDEERKAIQEAAKAWKEFVRRFVESRAISPGDPIEFLLESNRSLLARSPSTATLAITIDEQVEFATREAPDLWTEAVRVACGSTPARAPARRL